MFDLIGSAKGSSFPEIWWVSWCLRMSARQHEQ